MTPWDQGHRDGVNAGRDAWIGNRWTFQVSREMPNRHSERQQYLAGFAAGLAGYNRSIVLGE